MKINLILNRIIGSQFYAEPNEEQLEELKGRGYEIFLKTKEFIILKGKEEKYYTVLFQNATQQHHDYLTGISELIDSHNIFKMKKMEKYQIRDTSDIFDLFDYMKDKRIRHEFNENHLFRTENSILYFDINNQDLSCSIINSSDAPSSNAEDTPPRTYGNGYALFILNGGIVGPKNGIEIIDKYLKNKFKYNEER